MKKVLYTLLAIFTLVLVSLTSFNKVYASDSLPDEMDITEPYEMLRASRFDFDLRTVYDIYFILDDEEYLFKDGTAVNINGNNFTYEYVFYLDVYSYMIVDDDDYYALVLDPTEEIIYIESTYQEAGYWHLEKKSENNEESNDELDPTNPSDWDIYWNNPDPIELNVRVRFNFFDEYGYIMTEDWIDYVDTVYIEFPYEDDVLLKLDEIDYSLNLRWHTQPEYYDISEWEFQHNGLDFFYFDLLKQEISSGYDEFTKFAVKLKDNYPLKDYDIFLTADPGKPNGDEVVFDMINYGIVIDEVLIDSIEEIYIYELGNSFGHDLSSADRFFNKSSIVPDYKSFVIKNDGFDYLRLSESDNKIYGHYPIKHIAIKFVDGGLRPAFDGNEHFVTNVDDPDDVNYFVSFIRAIDDFDGDISDQIEIQSDGYTANKNTLGQYDVTLYVEDSSGNSSTFTFVVHVVDVTSPDVIYPSEPFKVSYDKTFDLSLIFGLLEVSDNYYSEGDLDYIIFEEDYTANKTVLGIYDVTLVVFDPSENETTVTIKVQVIDGVGPVINGVSEIIKSDARIMTTVEILSGITAYDELDGDVTDSIEIISDTYTGNAHIPNRNNTWYEVKIQAQDLSGNKTTKIIKIKVIDDTSPDWYITNGVTINLSPNTELTRSQILTLLTKAGKVSISGNSRVTYTTDSYTGNEGVPGTYVLAFTVEEPNGNQSEYLYGVNVLSAGEDDDDFDVVPDDPTLSDKLTDFFKNNLTAIVLTVVLICGVLIYLSIKPPKRRR